MSESRCAKTRDLAELFGVTQLTIREWIKRGWIKGYKVGGRYCVPHEEYVRLAWLVDKRTWLQLRMRELMRELTYDKLAAFARDVSNTIAFMILGSSPLANSLASRYYTTLMEMILEDVERYLGVKLARGQAHL